METWQLNKPRQLERELIKQVNITMLHSNQSEGEVTIETNVQVNTLLYLMSPRSKIYSVQRFPKAKVTIKAAEE